MNTATIPHRRPMLPMVSMLVAGAAVALGVVAIVTDDGASTTPPSAPVVTTPAVEAPAAAAAPRIASGRVTDGAEECRFARPSVVTRC